MNIYFIILCIMTTLAIGINLAKHGEDKEGEYNFWSSLIAGVIEIILIYLAIKQGF